MDRSLNMAAGLVLLLVMSAGLSAWQEEGGRREMKEMMEYRLRLAESNLYDGRLLLRFHREIDLSEKQLREIENRTLAYHEHAMKRQAEIKNLENRFALLLNDESVDRRKLERLALEIGNLKTRLQIDRINHLLDLRAILDREQIRKLTDLRRRFRPFHRDGERRNRSDEPEEKKEQGSPPESAIRREEISEHPNMMADNPFIS